MKCQSVFSLKKNETNIASLSSAEKGHRVVKVNIGYNP